MNNIKTVFSIILSALTFQSFASICPAKCMKNPEESSPKIMPKHIKKTSDPGYCLPELSRRCFPMVERKFFINRNMVEHVKMHTPRRGKIFDFDELSGMLILEAIQLLDIGDPDKINPGIDREFNPVYSKYIEFSQKLVSLEVTPITFTNRIPFARPTQKPPHLDGKPTTHTLSRVDPYAILGANHWLKAPMRITLSSHIDFTTAQCINWHQAQKSARYLAFTRSCNICAARHMHLLWEYLPYIFPKV